ncbi:MAG: TRAP transporter substrate-binding protein DctP [Methylococcales bacterium]|nr:TRAP transporter substrate-binding protein DctP [Methylococcales bacterium]
MKRIFDMLKKLIYMFLLLLVSNSAVQAFTFKIATLSPDGSVWMNKMRAGANEINEKTDNRVSFKFYPGGIMGGDKNVLRKMQFGQLHGAAMPNTGLASVYPDIQLYNLILKFKSLQELDYAREKMDSFLLAGLKKKKLVSFGISEMGFAYIMSTTPVANLADLRQQKTWVPNSHRIAIHAFEASKISPIPLPLRDVLMGLQTGMINAVAGTPTGALALQWHTKIKYVTDVPLSYIYGIFVINEKSFKKISKKDQQIVTKVMRQVVIDIDKQSRQDNLNAIAALKSQGIEFVAVKAGAIAELKKVMETANQKIIRASGLSEKLVRQLNSYLSDFASKTVQVVGAGV